MSRTTKTKVLNAINDCPEGVTVAQLTEIMGGSSKNIGAHCSNLFKAGDVDRAQQPTGNKGRQPFVYFPYAN